MITVHVHLGLSTPGNLVYSVKGLDRSQIDPRFVLGDNSTMGAGKRGDGSIVYVTHISIVDCAVWQRSRKKLIKRGTRDVVIGHSGKLTQPNAATYQGA